MLVARIQLGFTQQQRAAAQQHGWSSTAQEEIGIEVALTTLPCRCLAAGVRRLNVWPQPRHPNNRETNREPAAQPPS